jgi:hypothetical protein
MMPSQIEERYGVPLPIDVLWRELEQRYGAEVVTELQGIYRQATRRYGRAGRLNQMRRNLANWDRHGVKTEKTERYRAQLADPQAYIDQTADSDG